MVENLPPLGFGSFASSTQLMRDSALMRATTELFLEEEGHSPDEVRRYEELVAHLLPKVTDADRVFLAERLANRADAPQAVVRMLAKDKIAIAAPVLRASPVLAALDLLSIIAATGPDHHRIIGERRGLPPEVRQALRMTSDRALATVLDDIEAANAAPIATAKPSATKPTSSIAVTPVPVETTPAATDGSDHAELPPPTSPPSPATREPIVVRGRLDPWSFIELDHTARLKLMGELASRPPPDRRPGGTSGRVDRAFRVILGAAQIVGLARRGEHNALVQAIASSLELDRDFVKACLDDATGEPLAICLKALGLDNVQAQQVFLLATPRVGRETQSFFRLSDIYAGMEPSLAETVAEAWRESRQSKPPRHVPHLAENSGRARTGTAEPARPSAPAQTDRKAQGSGERA
jgi:hypothetical protein